MNTNQGQTLLGIFGVILAAIFWGTTGTAASYAPAFSPVAMGSFAMGIGGLLQGFIASRAIFRQRRELLKQWRYIIIGVLAVVIYPLAFYSSMYLAGVAIGTLVAMGSAPIFSALIEYFFDKLPLTWQWRWGAFVGVLGMLLLISGGSNGQSFILSQQVIFGFTFGLLAGLTYAVYSWSARRLMQNGIATSSAMGVTFGLGGLLLLAVFSFTGPHYPIDLFQISVAIYMAFGPMFLGYLSYGFGLARIRASAALTITLLEPVIATLLAVMLLGERVTLTGWFGIICIILCLIIIALPDKIRNYEISS